MRFQWEAQDIKPGMAIRSTTTNAVNAIFMVGYRRLDVGNEYLLIDLADGLVVLKCVDPEDLADHLNRGYRPYRLQLAEQRYDKFEKVTTE